MPEQGYATGAKVEGGIAAIGMFGVGLFWMGGGIWIYRRILDAKIVRVFPKETAQRFTAPT